MDTRQLRAQNLVALFEMDKNQSLKPRDPAFSGAPRTGHREALGSQCSG
jgi:hypothetical protein